MYERLSVHEVWSALEGLVRHVRARGVRGVLLKTSSGLAGWPTRAAGHFGRGAVRVGLDAILAGVGVALSQPCVVVGDVVFRQVAGSPIGGPLSDVSAALVLGMREYFWQTLDALRDHQRFGRGDLRGLGATESVASARYVDDVIAVSRVLCCGCLDVLIQENTLASALIGKKWIMTWEGSLGWTSWPLREDPSSA